MCVRHIPHNTTTANHTHAIRMRVRTSARFARYYNGVPQIDARRARRAASARLHLHLTIIDASIIDHGETCRATTNDVSRYYDTSSCNNLCVLMMYALPSTHHAGYYCPTCCACPTSWHIQHGARVGVCHQCSRYNHWFTVSETTNADCACKPIAS